MTSAEPSSDNETRWTRVRLKALKIVVGGLVQIMAIAGITLMELAAIQHGDNGQFLLPLAALIGWLSGVKQDKLLDMILPK